MNSHRIPSNQLVYAQYNKKQNVPYVLCICYIFKVITNLDRYLLNY